jgi:hypothetical protein
MAACSYCHSSILFRGMTVGELEFCSGRCASLGRELLEAYQLPSAAVAEPLKRVHEGRCPRCQGPGPVEVFTAYTVWSVVYSIWWVSDPQVTCRDCATKRQLGAIALSLLLGWWSLPGLILTPVQVVRDLKGLRQRIAPDKPSPALEQYVRLQLLAAAKPKPADLDIGALITGLGSSEPDVRMQSATILGDRGALAAGALPHLERLLNDPVRVVRMRAKWALETIREKSRRP